MCNQLKTLIYLFAAVFFLTGCDSVGEAPIKVVDLSQRGDTDAVLTRENQAEQFKSYLFGFDLRSTPQEDARQYLPFLTYLQQATGYRFELVITGVGENLSEKLGQGQVDFAAIGAVSYIKSKERYDVKAVARGLNALNRAEYRSLIITATDSKIQRIEQLVGKRIAFGDANSTQGHLIPRIDLLKHEIELDDLATYEYTGSHNNCADAVINGRFDACGIQDTMGYHLQERGMAKVIHSSEYYPSSGIAAHGGVLPEVVEKVRRALVEFDAGGKHASGLYHWERTEMPNGFVSASEDDYREMHKWMERLGFLASDDESK